MLQNFQFAMASRRGPDRVAGGLKQQSLNATFSSFSFSYYKFLKP